MEHNFHVMPPPTLLFQNSTKRILTLASATVCLILLAYIGFFSTSPGSNSQNAVNSEHRTSSSDGLLSPETVVTIPEKSFDPSDTSASEAEVRLQEDSINAFQRNASLRVLIVGFSKEFSENPQGQCLVAVYDTPSSFNKIDMAISRVAVTAEDISVEIDLGEIEAKSIAIAAFHDQNKNGILDKNGFGIPIEPYGFSNNPKSAFGPPSFMAAVVQDWKMAAKPITINLNKLK